MIHRCTHCGLERDLPESEIEYMHIECANAGYDNTMEREDGSGQPQPAGPETPAG